LALADFSSSIQIKCEYKEGWLQKLEVLKIMAARSNKYQEELISFEEDCRRNKII